MAVEVIETPFTIALSTEIISSGAIKALNTRKIQSHQAHSAVTAPDNPGFDDIVHSENFPEIQVTITISVQFKKEDGVYLDVGASLEEVHELIVADTAIPVRVQ